MSTSATRTEPYDHDASAQAWRRMQNTALIIGWAFFGGGIMILSTVPPAWRWKLLVGVFLMGAGTAIYIATLIIGGQARILEGQAELARELHQNRPSTSVSQTKEI